MTDLHKAISGALFDFAGFLTTRPKSTPFGSCEDANAAVEMLKEWAGTRGLQLDEADVTNWSEALAAPVVPPGYALVQVGATRAEAGFRFDGMKQEYIPTLLVEFTPVPVGQGGDHKGWTDRDALLAVLAAAPQPKDKP